MQQADAFPWIAIGDSIIDTTGDLYTPHLRAAADFDGYVRDRYTEAVAEVERVEGEDDFTHRMRVMSYLHLTRFVRVLLDRKDRMSMAVGLEVRVPFCDHRLVDYVYNTPWSLKTYDGREKSLLRGAVRDVLPQSVVERVKARTRRRRTHSTARTSRVRPRTCWARPTTRTSASSTATHSSR